MRRPLSLGLLLLVGACATNGALRRVETQVVVLRVETARQDSIRAAELGRIMAVQMRILDSLAASRLAVRQFKSELGVDLTEIQRQLLQIQELTGQSTKRLSELRADMETRAQQVADTARPIAAASPVSPVVPDSGAAAKPPAGASVMYETARTQYRQGSYATGRTGFLEFLRWYPTDERAPDGYYFVGESYTTSVPDSAKKYLEMVVARYPSHSRAPGALFKLGFLAEQHQDTAGARVLYQRLLKEYPRSDEADVARDHLAKLKP